MLKVMCRKKICFNLLLAPALDGSCPKAISKSSMHVDAFCICVNKNRKIRLSNNSSRRCKQYTVVLWRIPCRNDHRWPLQGHQCCSTPGSQSDEQPAILLGKLPYNISPTGISQKKGDSLLNMTKHD